MSPLAVLLSIAIALLTIPTLCFLIFIYETRSSEDECSTGDQTILGLQIFLDHRSKDLHDTAPPPSPPFWILGANWRSSGCLLSPIHRLLDLLSFCLLRFSLRVGVQCSEPAYAQGTDDADTVPSSFSNIVVPVI